MSMQPTNLEMELLMAPSEVFDGHIHMLNQNRCQSPLLVASYNDVAEGRWPVQALGCRNCDRSSSNSNSPDNWERNTTP